jgi:hypothetical protein
VGTTPTNPRKERPLRRGFNQSFVPSDEPAAAMNASIDELLG